MANENKKAQQASISRSLSLVGHALDALSKGLSRMLRIANALHNTLMAFIRHQHRLSLIRVALGVIRMRGLSGFRQSLRYFVQGSVIYDRWIKVHDVLTDDDRESIRLHVESAHLRLDAYL